MATVHREQGFTFHIWPNDHEPPHVHAYKGGALVVITISQQPEVRKVKGMNDPDVVRAVRIVIANIDLLMEGWRRFHGQEDVDG